MARDNSGVEHAVSSTPEPDTPGARPLRTKREVEQAKRRRNRLLPLLALALVSFIGGAVLAAGSPEGDSADRFMRAWADQDYAAMHAELTEEAAAQYPLEEFESAYLGAQRTATASAINPGDIEGPEGDAVTVNLAVRTNLFGVVEGELRFPYEDEKLAWEPHLTFPGLESGEQLGRSLELSERAALLANDGTPLAQGQGAERSSPLGTAALDVTGEVGEPDAEQAAQFFELGYPADSEVGISGLERAFNSQLAGKPGGALLATQGDGGDVPEGTPGRELATAEAVAGKPVKTTIDPELQEEAVAALAGQFGGVAVLDARNGSVRALAGAAYSQPAPPGSTFKIVTATAALEEKVVTLKDSFDVVTSVNVGGRAIENSHDEACGGSFAETFANSCNTVFAPLGTEIGEEALVEMAERFGFNQPPSLYNDEIIEMMDPPRSEIPTTIGDELDVGVTAIGQGKVLATPLEMASIAQTIAAGGQRSPTSIVAEPDLAPDPQPVKVTTPEIARIMGALMEDVVEYGTGVNASLGRGSVAGKTGTAELGPKPPSEQPPEVQNPGPLRPGEEPPEPEQILDAWFTGYAPVKNPKLVVAVLLANASGDGGEVAAPVARAILEEAVKKG